MALLDFLKKKEELQEAKERNEVKKAPAARETKSVKKTARKEPKRTRAKKATVTIGGFSYDVIKSPHITEKATRLSESHNCYVFKVAHGANKTEIKKSIEGIYGVNVLHVQTVKVPPKRRRLGRVEGFKKGYTKAIVTLQKGQKIEII